MATICDFQKSPWETGHKTGHLSKQVKLRGLLNPGSEEIGNFRDA